MISGCENTKIYLYDSNALLTSTDNNIDAHAQCLLKTLDNHQSGSIHSLDLNPFQSNLLASGSHDNTIRIWDVNKGKELNKLEGHTNEVRCLVLLPNNQLASGSRDNTIRIWDVNKGKELNKLEGHTDAVWCLVVLPNNQ